jgi:hypothetical protein
MSFEPLSSPLRAPVLTGLFVCVSLALRAPVATAQPRHPAPPASAEETEHARGIELSRQHRDAEARDVFRAIYERTREPRALARQAAAEAALGDWVVAEEHLSAALANTSDAWITQNRAGLTTDLESFRQHVGLLEVSSNTPRAEVWVGGARAATLPLAQPLRVRSGSVSFEVRAEGFTPETRSVNVEAGMRLPTRELVNLNPVAPAATPGAPTAGAAPVVTPVVITVPTQPPRDEPPPTWFNGMHIAGLSLAAAGLAGVGVGVAGLVMKSGYESTLETDTCLNDTAFAVPACREAFDGSESAGTMSIVGFAAGGALLAGGVVLMIIPGSQPSRSRVSLTPGPGQAGAGLRVTF